MKILITGGCGFVGSSLAHRLREDFTQSEIICLDNLKRRGSELNLSRLRKAGIRFIHGDIRNKEDLEVINKIGSPAISEVFTVVSGIFGSRKSFRLETIRGFSYEKAKQYCDELGSYNLECKVISG